MQDPEKAADIAESTLGRLVGYALRRAQMRVYESFFAALAGEGITPARYSALVLIGRHPGISQTALSRALGIARSGSVTLMDLLGEMGLVEREAIEGDKRAYALKLTAGGKRRLSALRRRVAAHERSITAGLSAREKKALLGLLSRVGRKAGKPRRPR